MGSQHGAQGEVRANISVEHEEGLGAPSQDLIPEMVETTSCAQRGKFLQVPVPRDPRVSSVRSEETDTMSRGTGSFLFPGYACLRPTEKLNIYRESRMPKKETS